MKIVLDTHTHTIASGHAYNTRNEMLDAAVHANLELIALTEHGPMMPGSCNYLYFYNLKILPRKRGDLEIMYGVELNVIDYKGKVDLEPSVLGRTDLRIASLHIPCLKPGTVEENTEAMLGIIRNPWVDILGHPDDGRYRLNYERLIPEIKKYGKIVEINNNSMSPLNSRVNARENDLIVLELCKKYEVPIVMSSDAHADFMVGQLDQAVDVVESVDFPEELIMNVSKEKFKSVLESTRQANGLS